MRKSHFILALIIVIGITAYIIPVFSPSSVDTYINWGIIATILVVLAILAFFFEFEAAAISSKEIALVSMLATICAMARVPFAAIPNVQPCTYLIICSGYVFGPIVGFMVGAVTPLVSNFFLGQGPWTLYQMFAWGMAGISASYFKRLKPGTVGIIVFGVAWGYLYGWIMNTWFWLSFIYPLTLKTFIVYQLTSVWFDTLHALSNAMFLAFLGKKTIGILERFRKKFNWTVFSG